jgi:hypothetical protein
MTATLRTSERRLELSEGATLGNVSGFPHARRQSYNTTVFSSMIAAAVDGVCV